MNDENNLTNVEGDEFIHKTKINVSGSPMFDLSKRLQILNLGEGNKSKSKNTNFLSAPLQSIENVNSESKKTLSRALVSDFNSLFPTLENEGTNRNVFGEILDIDGGFESSIDTFLTGTIKPSSSKRSLTDLESLMSDTVRPERSEMLSIPPKPSNSVDDVLTNDLLSGSNSCTNPFDNYFGICSDDTIKIDRQLSELFVSTTEITETETQATRFKENSGQFLLKIATPYKTKTVPVHGLDSEESEYSKKRDLLMQSDKKLYGNIENERIRGRGRSLMAQMDEAFKSTQISSENNESKVVPTIPKDERNNEEVKMTMDAEEKSPELGNNDITESLTFLRENLDSGCREIEGRKQVTFALSDEIIQPSPTSDSDCSRTENNSNFFELKSSGETQEIHFAEQQSYNTEAQISSIVLETNSHFIELESFSGVQATHSAEQQSYKIEAPKSSTAQFDTSGNAEPSTSIASDSDSESDYQSLSSSVNEETPFKGGTPLALTNPAVQLENSWLNFSYHQSPNLESTFLLGTESQLDTPLSCKSMSETVIPEELESDLSDHFESVNSTIPDMQDVENDEVVSDVTPIPEDGSFDLIDPETVVPNGMLIPSENPNCTITYGVQEFKCDSRDEFTDLDMLLSEVPNQPNNTPTSETTESDLLENFTSLGPASKEVIPFENERKSTITFEVDEPNDYVEEMDSFTVPLTTYYQVAMRLERASFANNSSPSDASASSEEDVSVHSDETDQLNETVLIPFNGNSLDDINILKTESSHEATVNISYDSEELNLDEGRFIQISNSSFSTVIEKMNIDEEEYKMKSCLADDISDENCLDRSLVDSRPAVDDASKNEAEGTRKLDESAMAVEGSGTDKDNAEESKADGMQDFGTVLEPSVNEIKPLSDIFEMSNHVDILAPTESDILPDVDLVCEPKIVEEIDDVLDVQGADGIDDSSNKNLNYTDQFRGGEGKCGNQPETSSENVCTVRPRLKCDERNPTETSLSTASDVQILPCVQSLCASPVEKSTDLFPLREDCLIELAGKKNLRDSPEYKDIDLLDTSARFEADCQNLPEVEPVLEPMARKSIRLSPIQENSIMDVSSEEGLQNNLSSGSLNGTKADTIENELEETRKLEVPELNNAMTNTVNAPLTAFEENEFLGPPERNEEDLENLSKWKYLHESVDKTPVKLSPITERSVMDLMDGEEMENCFSKKSLNETKADTIENELEETRKFGAPELDDEMIGVANVPLTGFEESEFLRIPELNKIVPENPPKLNPVLESVNKTPIELSPITERNIMDPIKDEVTEDSLSKRSLNETEDDVVRNGLEIMKLEESFVNVDASGVVCSSSIEFRENKLSNNTTYILLADQKEDNLVDILKPMESDINISSNFDPPLPLIEDTSVAVESDSSNSVRTNLVDETQLFNLASDQESPFTIHKSESTKAVLNKSSPDASIQTIPVELSDTVEVSIAPRTMFKCMQILPSAEIQERLQNLSINEASTITPRTENSAVAEAFPSNSSDDLPFTPKIPKSKTGLKGSLAEAAKLPASLNRLLTPLRENISRLCTPMNVSRQGNLTCSDISNPAPIFTLEESEDCNKTRLVVELPTSLLDVSTTTLDRMFGQVDPLNFNAESNTCEGVEKQLMITEKAEECENQIDLETHLKLQQEHEQLKSICSALRHNEEELEQAYNQAKDCIRVLENRYEKLRDYTNRYICYMNEEYDKLETELRISKERETMMKSQLT